MAVAMQKAQFVAVNLFRQNSCLTYVLRCPMCRRLNVVRMRTLGGGATIDDLAETNSRVIPNARSRSTLLRSQSHGPTY